jgi:amino acid permease
VGRPTQVNAPSKLSADEVDVTEHHHTGVEASFNTVALLTFGQGWATRCFDLAIAIKCFGVSVSYLIIVKVRLAAVSRIVFVQLTDAFIARHRH